MEVGEVLVEPESPCGELAEDFEVGLLPPLPEPLVDEDLERDFRDLTTLVAPDGAGGEVAGVGVGNLHLSVDLVEGGLRQVDLSPHRHRGGRGNREGHARDGLHVLGHIVADEAVAPRKGAVEQTVFVVEDDRDAVDLLLDDDADLLLPLLFGLLNPREQLGGAIRFVQAEHRDGVFALGERGVEVAAHPLCRAVRLPQFRVGRFQGDQAVEEAVVFEVADLAVSIDIVGALVFGEEGAQTDDLCFGIMHEPIVCV